jgi:hypothetical protein
MVKGSRKKVSAEEQKSRGNTGYFAGEPLELLQSYLPDYIQSFGNREAFWSNFRGEWNRKYPSKLTPTEMKELDRIIIKHRLQRNTGTRKKPTQTVDVDVEETEDAVEEVVEPQVEASISNQATLSPNYPPVPYPPVHTCVEPNYPPTPYPPIPVSRLAEDATSKSSKEKGKAKEVSSDEPDPEMSEGSGKGKGKAGGRTDLENTLLARAAAQKVSVIDSFCKSRFNF